MTVRDAFLVAILVGFWVLASSIFINGHVRTAVASTMLGVVNALLLVKD